MNHDFRSRVEATSVEICSSSATLLAIERMHSFTVMANSIAGRARTVSDISGVSGPGIVPLPPYSSQNILEELKKDQARRDTIDLPKSRTMPLDGSFDGMEPAKLMPERRTLSSMTDKTRSTGSSGRSSRASGEFRPGGDEDVALHAGNHPDLEGPVNLLVNDSAMRSPVIRSARADSAMRSPQIRSARATASEGMYGGLNSSDSDEDAPRRPPQLVRPRRSVYEL